MFTETAAESWQSRYGVDALEGLGVSDGFLAHRSVRDFSDQEIPDSVMQGLIGCAQSAATSSNLQLWSVVSVQEPARRAEIAKLCSDQKQVHEAAWYLFCPMLRLRTLEISQPSFCTRTVYIFPVEWYNTPF